MKNRVISGVVTRTGPPRSICLRKIGITEPDEPSTLPKRTATKRVSTSGCSANDSMIHSQTAFDWPMMFFGFAAAYKHARGEHVVRDRLQRVRLEHADVLVRSRVEEHLWP